MRAADPAPLRPFALLAGFGYYALFGGWLDTVLLLVFSAWRNKHGITDVLSEYIDEETLQNSGSTVLGFSLGLLVFSFIRLVIFLTSDDEAGWTTPMRPLLIPAKTTHRRTFPEKHDFAYSYLVVGIPVGWNGTYGGMVSSGVEEKRSWLDSFSLVPQDRKGWFDVDPAEYLERGNAHLGLRGKLDAYLRSQGADPAQYPDAYLVTAAKFLGYSFNPVSFWYLYSKDKELSAMILEVNNTFDERRMYFLTSDAIPAEQRVKAGGKGDVLGTTSQDDEEPVSSVPAARLTKQWPKDFHVSPFNSRKGSYSLSAADFFGGGAHSPYNLNTTITLKSSKDHPKLVARLFATGPPVDPGSMSFINKLAFLCSWWWVGFVTFPRIVKEAGVLFFRRSLHVWYRPEPLKQSIGRRVDDTERRLEPFFRDYLRHLVEQSPAPIAVRYVPSGVDADAAPVELMRSPAAEKQPKRAEELEFKVLTPAFYARFVHYAHDLEAVCCEFQNNCTVWVSRPDLLPKLILKKPAPPLRTASVPDFVYFRAIRALRRRPERIERPLTSQGAAAPDDAGKRGSPNVEKVDIRDFRISPMDGFVLASADRARRGEYRSLVLRAFLADRLALGAVGLLDLQQFILRAGLAWVLSSFVAPVLATLLVTL
ncbi:DNA-binding wrky domain-containing protein [Colletotrichum musicola]|uniref:DNA-binding wrky domain-containing protein n=1 Tax=Colletotrichum musicola TaxID=2175873 RepID=A0A8H6U6S5_9PEZI|nr:DNA-binding wrky domain-containing protein [Colletotrichum musicola]